MDDWYLWAPHLPPLHARSFHLTVFHLFGSHCAIPERIASVGRPPSAPSLDSRRQGSELVCSSWLGLLEVTTPFVLKSGCTMLYKGDRLWTGNPVQSTHQVLYSRHSRSSPNRWVRELTLPYAVYLHGTMAPPIYPDGPGGISKTCSSTLALSMRFCMWARMSGTPGTSRSPAMGGSLRKGHSTRGLSLSGRESCTAVSHSMSFLASLSFLVEASLGL